MTFEKFKDLVLDKVPFHFSQNSKTELLSWSDFDQLLIKIAADHCDDLKLYLHSNLVEKSHYMSSFENFSEVLNKIHHLKRQGAAIVLNDVGKFNSLLSIMTQTLSYLFQARVQANIYVSQEKSQAFASHFDVHDAFVFQCAGRKKWYLYENRVEAPINHENFFVKSQLDHEKSKGTLLKTLILQPGDFLYIPRGYYHDAIALKGPSLHVTFGVTRPVPLDILSLFYDEALQHTFMRQYINLDTISEVNQTLSHFLKTCLDNPLFIEKIHQLFQIQPELSCKESWEISHYQYQLTSNEFSVIFHSGSFWLSTNTYEVPIPSGQEKQVDLMIKLKSFTLNRLIEKATDFSSTFKDCHWDQLIKDLYKMGVLEISK